MPRNRLTGQLPRTRAAIAAIGTIVLLGPPIIIPAISAAAATSPPATAASVMAAVSGVPAPASDFPAVSAQLAMRAAAFATAAAHGAHLAHLGHLGHVAYLQRLARLAYLARIARAQAARQAATAARHAAAAAARHAAAAAPARTAAPVTTLATTTAYGSPQGIAAAMLAARGEAGQFGCLKALWALESGWNVHAANPGSGAYGIPQALPGSKMAAAGPDWQTNPATQIRWGLSYIAASYGTPCAAWAHDQADGWY